LTVSQADLDALKSIDTPSVCNAIEYLEPRCVVNAKALIGESPVWDPQRKCVYWVDIPKRALHEFVPSRNEDTVHILAEEIGCVALGRVNEVVVAFPKCFHRYSLSDGRSELLFHAIDEAACNRFNDGKTDRQGRFWCGSLDRRESFPTGGLYRLDKSGGGQRVLADVVCSNALCWSPDGRTMYFGDSARNTIWAFDFDVSSGEIGKKDVFIKLDPSEGIVDGATVDSEGFVWVLLWGGWCVGRFDPQGRKHLSMRLPVSQPTCPVFGGEDLSTLYVTSARQGLGRSNLEREPLAGGLFAIDTEYCGIVETPFDLNVRSIG
jgi:sugar lactone lactonase YvrE